MAQEWPYFKTYLVCPAVWFLPQIPVSAVVCIAIGHDLMEWYSRLRNFILKNADMEI